MTDLEFVDLEAPFTADRAAQEAKRRSASLGRDVFHAAKAYVAEGLALLREVGYDPTVLATTRARLAVRAYALFMLGVGDERDWDRARIAWRKQAAKDIRPQPALVSRVLAGGLYLQDPRRL